MLIGTLQSLDSMEDENSKVKVTGGGGFGCFMILLGFAVLLNFGAILEVIKSFAE